MNEDQELPVEYDSQGLSIGVEAEKPASVEVEIHDPFDPAKIEVQTRTMTVDLLLARLRRGVLDLSPDFQRHAGVWNQVNQSKLIESLLLRIPLPTLYAAESGDEGWAIVDGIQRLTTIARFVDPTAINDTPLRLSGLEYLRYNGMTYSDLPGAMQTRINETELIIHLIRAGTPEAVKFNIFARINTGGAALTLQELRHALIPGPARELLRNLAESQEFISATQNSVRHERMADREMVLRFLAFRLTAPRQYRRGDLDAFLREAMKELNKASPAKIELLSREFKRAMISAEKIFQEHAFRKRLPGQNRRQPINKALFEAVAVNLAALPTPRLRVAERNSQLIRDEFDKLAEDAKFQQSISVGTGDVEKVRRRFRIIEQLFEKATA